MANEIKFEIKKMIGALSAPKSGWTKELNLVEWNGRPAKYDIRDWTENHEKMGKGVTLNEDEAKELYNLLKVAFEK